MGENIMIGRAMVIDCHHEIEYHTFVLHAPSFMMNSGADTGGCRRILKFFGSLVHFWLVVAVLLRKWFIQRKILNMN